MNKTKLAHLVPALLFSSALVLAGCGGGSSGGSTPPPPSGGGDTPPPSDGGASNSPTLSFSLSGAVALQAMDQTVVETASLAKASDGRSLFTYRVVNEGLSEAAAESLRAEPRLRAANDEAAGTNLLAIDEDGNASLALDSNYPIKVMYSVTDPAGEYVYLALDTGWWNWDGNDYSQFIAQTNCAFYRVNIADDSYSCVEEGLFVQNMDDNYMQSISGNQKPVQFDSAGNVYFAATSFTPQCDSWPSWNGTEEITETWCHIASTTWEPRIYRVTFDEGASVTPLTQDNTRVDFFLVLPSGEIVYQAWNQERGSSGLNMVQGNQTIDLSGENWGVNFFTADTNNTVLFGDWGTEGIRFARPRTQGGAERTVLSTKLFGQTDGGYYSRPARIIVGDDGRLYGAFESYRSYYDEDNNYQWENILSVYQILPYDPVPKAELNLGNDGWWGWMGRTPFQIAKGYLYYRESVIAGPYGSSDVIRMVKLEDRSVRTILEPDLNAGTDRYRVNTWRLSGDKLYFSAEDLSNTVAVSGAIDTLAVRDGAAVDDYLSITEVASALGASADIRDIEVLSPQQPAMDTGMAPKAEFFTSPDNLYSVSIDFTKYMNKASVEAGLSFMDGDTEIETMRVWLYQSLHLIPDLSVNNFNQPLWDEVGRGLNNDTTYTVALGPNTRDAWNRDLEGTRLAEFTTVPTHGWIAADTTANDAAISSGKVAKFIGPKDGKETFVLTKDGVPVDAGGNLRVEFSARNTGWGGVNLVLWNQTRFATFSNYYDGYEANLRLSGWSSVDYRQEEYSWTTWGSGETSALFNGTWQRYRIDFNGTSLVIAYSTDGVEFTEIDSLEVYDYATSKYVKGAISNFRNRADTDGEEFHLLFRLDAGVLIDDLVVIDLDTEDERLAENFNAADANAIKAVFVEDVDDEYDLEGRW